MDRKARLSSLLVACSHPCLLRATLLCGTHERLPACTSHRYPHTFACRIEAVHKDKSQTTKVKFKNADGAYSTHRISFLHVVAIFTPLS